MTTANAPRRVVLDTDFADGARFLAAWAQASSPLAAPLHYLAVAPRLPEAARIADARLRASWPLNVPGFHRIVLDLSLIHI